jgi:hypothetical protein
MANKFGTDILIQAPEPAAETPAMVSLHGEHINLFIERGPALGPVLEVTVDSVEEAKARLAKNGCQVVKDEPEFPRCYVRDPFGLIYNLTARVLAREAIDSGNPPQLRTHDAISESAAETAGASLAHLTRTGKESK